MSTSPKLTRILTPAEAMALSGPAVQREIAKINQGLRRGARHFWLEASLWPIVQAEIEAQGWACSDVEHIFTDVVAVDLSPAPVESTPSDDELTAAYQTVVGSQDAETSPGRHE